MAPIATSPRQLARDLLAAAAPTHLFSPRTAAAQPTSTTPSLPSTLRSVSRWLLPRTATGVSTVPQGYGNAPNGPDPGTVVGIVLGSVGGFLLLLWLFYTCVNLGNPPAILATGSVGDASEVTRKSRHKKRRHRSSGRSRRETVEIRQERIVPVPVSGGGERIVVDERSRSRARPGPPPPPPPMDDDDEIVVIEEHRPSRSRRESRHDRRSRRSSSFAD